LKGEIGQVPDLWIPTRPATGHDEKEKMNMELWRLWFKLSVKPELNEREREQLKTLDYLIKKEAAK
jgi:hypothetical protein